MPLTVNSKTYSLDISMGSAVQYAGPSHTFTVKDLAKLARVLPTPTKTSGGVSKYAAKFTRTLTLTGQPEASRDIIIDVSISAPVGAASADIDAALADVGSFVASATFKAAVKSGQLTF